MTRSSIGIHSISTPYPDRNRRLELVWLTEAPASCASSRSAAPDACAGLGQRAGGAAAVRSPAVQVQQLLDLVEGEAELLGTLDEPQQPHRRIRVVPIAAGGTGRLVQQPAPLVVPQRLAVHTGPAGQLTGAHGAIVNPVPNCGVKPGFTHVMARFGAPHRVRLERDRHMRAALPIDGHGRREPLLPTRDRVRLINSHEPRTDRRGRRRALGEHPAAAPGRSGSGQEEPQVAGPPAGPAMIYGNP
jgi:hypothetical protein